MINATCMADFLREKELSNITNILKCSYDRAKRGYSGHIVCTYKYRENKERQYRPKVIDPVFDDYFMQALDAKKMTVDKQVPFIMGLYNDAGEIVDKDTIIEKCTRKYLSYKKKKQRFNNKLNMISLFKKNLNVFFVTFTYDDKKQTEESFRTRLKKCIGNLHTRRGWLVMGVFERAPETKRLHFHGILACAKSEMIGSIELKREYNPLSGKMEEHHSNTFFEDRFGRNDFAPIYCTDISEARLYHDGKRNQQVIEYITKYIMKSGEPAFFTRGMATHFELPAEYAEFASSYVDFVQKFVLFDDIIDETSEARKHIVMRC